MGSSCGRSPILANGLLRCFAPMPRTPNWRPSAGAGGQTSWTTRRRCQMNEKIIELRVHTELLDPPKVERQKRHTAEDAGERWPSRALLIDCETTIDERQSL